MENLEMSFNDKQIVEGLENIEKQLIETGKAADSMGKMVSDAVDGVVKSETLLEKTVKEEAAAEEARAAKRAENAKGFAKQEADAAKRHEEHLKMLDEESQKLAANAKQIQTVQKANRSWAQAIKETIAGQQLGGKTLGEWTAQARGFVGRIGEAAMKIPGVSLAAKGLGLALKATGIGSVIALLGSLVTALFKVQPIADKISQVWAGINAVFSVTASRIVTLGSAIGKLFSGDFSGAWETAGQAVSGFGEELANAAIDAYNLEKRLQALRDVTLSQSVEAARQRVEIEKLRAVVDDGTQSIGRRADAARKAAALEEDIAKKALDRALEQQLADQKSFEINKGLGDSKNKLAESIINVTEQQIALDKVQSNAEKEQREFRKEAAAERQKQMEEERKRAEQLRKEYEKLFADIQRQAESLEIENIFNPVDRVIAQFDAAKADINRIRERLLEIAPDAAARARVEEEVAKLFDQLIIKYREELFAAQQEIEKIKKGTEPIQPLPIADTIDDDLIFRAKETVQKIKTSIQETIAGQEPRSLAEILGLSEEGLEGLKDAANQVIDSLGEIADARVKEADAAVDAAERRVNAAQEALIREQDLAEQGLANNTDLAKQQLDVAKKLQEEAEKERAKAIRTQILLDAASQISSLITSSASIFKSLAPLGPFGIAGAIATIAVMFGAFAKAKSDALKAAAIPKFRKGGKLEGPAHEYGGIAVSDRDGNVYGEAEGGEWIVNRHGSREHDRFLSRLNDGEFAGVNLDRLFRPSASNPITEAAPRIERIEREFREIRETQHTRALESAYYTAAAQIVQAIEEKEVVTPLTNYRVTKKKGRNTYTKIVKAEN